MKVHFYDKQTFELLSTLKLRSFDPIQCNRIAIGIEHETKRNITWRLDSEPQPQMKQQEIEFI